MTIFNLTFQTTLIFEYNIAMDIYVTNTHHHQQPPTTTNNHHQHHPTTTTNGGIFVMMKDFWNFFKQAGAELCQAQIKLEVIVGFGIEFGV